MRTHTMSAPQRMAAGALDGASSGTAGKDQVPASIALGRAAPFIGRADIIAFPFVGWGALAAWALRAAAAPAYTV